MGGKVCRFDVEGWMEKRATEFQNLFQNQNSGTQQHNIRILDAKGSDAMTKKLVFHLPTD